MIPSIVAGVTGWGMGAGRGRKGVRGMEGKFHWFIYILRFHSPRPWGSENCSNACAAAAAT